MKITNYSKGILDDVRTTPIRLSESKKAEIEYTTGMTYNDWCKSMFGKLRIINTTASNQISNITNVTNQQLKNINTTAISQIYNVNTTAKSQI